MTKRKLSAGAAVVKEWFAADGEELREVVRAWLQETLEQEMTEAVGAGEPACAGGMAPPGAGR